MADLLEQADQLQADKKFIELFEILAKAYEADPTNIEIGWRFARAHYDASEEVTDNNKKKEYMLNGLALIKKIYESNPEDPLVNKWVAVMLSGSGDFVSSKEKIGNAYIIRDHALKSLEKRDDASLNHLLGRWCYTIANISWIERQVASALFASPPTATFEEALQYLYKSDKLAPGIRNQIAIGDTHTALKHNDQAKEWYAKAAALPYKGEKETQLHFEAEKKAK